MPVILSWDRPYARQIGSFPATWSWKKKQSQKHMINKNCHHSPRHIHMAFKPKTYQLTVDIARALPSNHWCSLLPRIFHRCFNWNLLGKVLGITHLGTRPESQTTKPQKNTLWTVPRFFTKGRMSFLVGFETQERMWIYIYIHSVKLT